MRGGRFCPKRKAGLKETGEITMEKKKGSVIHDTRKKRAERRLIGTRRVESVETKRSRRRKRWNRFTRRNGGRHFGKRKPRGGKIKS